MNLSETLSALEAAGSEQTRKTYARHGVTGPAYGVSYAVLEKLRKKIRMDHPLAEELWRTGNHDARVLATLIADPAQTSARLLKTWTEEVDNNVLAGAVSKLTSKTAVALPCFDEWSSSLEDRTCSAGWHLLAELAVSDLSLPDSFFQQQLGRIEREIPSAQNRTKYSMNGALIAIGTRNEGLEKQAIAAAARIGKVDVDHGDTACKTPDAASYIRKTAARRMARAKP